MSTIPRVGISRCLIGDEVRHDGTHRLHMTLIRLIGPHVEWVPVCPEVEVGMGTPREPIHLVAHARGEESAHTAVRLVGIASGNDWTERMRAWSRRKVGELARLDLSGYILKARSPSCGIDDVVVEGAAGRPRGRGLFAEVLIAAFPGLPVSDDAALADTEACRLFLEKVRRHHVDHPVR